MAEIPYSLDSSDQLRRQPNFIPNPSIDPELAVLGGVALELLGEATLDELVKAHQRFNVPVHIIQKDGSEAVDPNCYLKQLLGEIPAYTEAAKKSGMSSEQTGTLLLGTLNAIPTRWEKIVRPYDNLTYLTEALDQDSPAILSEQDIESISGMIAIAGKYGVIPDSLYAYSIARKVGLTVSDSTELLSSLSNANGGLSSDSLGPFSGALKTLKFAGVDPELVKIVFAELGGNGSSYHSSAYQLFEEVITFSCPANHISPQALLESYYQNRLEGLSIRKFLSHYLAHHEQIVPGNKEEILLPNQERERYFNLKTGHLEHAPLPYRISRGFDEGLRDLERLAKASIYRGQEVAEGFWIFDPAAEVWYSLGGKTSIASGKVRHHFLLYDMSKLSSEPHMVHVHPQDYAVMIRPPQEAALSRECADLVTKFLSSTPSRADYAVVDEMLEYAATDTRPRSLIAHSLGITEFTYPHDRQKIKQIATEFRDIRDSVILNTDLGGD